MQLRTSALAKADFAVWGSGALLSRRAVAVSPPVAYFAPPNKGERDEGERLLPHGVSTVPARDTAFSPLSQGTSGSHRAPGGGKKRDPSVNARCGKQRGLCVCARSEGDSARAQATQKAVDRRFFENRSLWLSTASRIHRSQDQRPSKANGMRHKLQGCASGESKEGSFV